MLGSPHLCLPWGIFAGLTGTLTVSGDPTSASAPALVAAGPCASLCGFASLGSSTDGPTVCGLWGLGILVVMHSAAPVRASLAFPPWGRALIPSPGRPRLHKGAVVTCCSQAALPRMFSCQFEFLFAVLEGGYPAVDLRGLKVILGLTFCEAIRLFPQADCSPHQTVHTISLFPHQAVPPGSLFSHKTVLLGRLFFPTDCCPRQTVLP